MLAADCNWLSPAEHQALIEVLARTTGNNPQVMVETAITAIREGNKAGLPLLKRAWEIDWSKMNDSNLNAVARSLNLEQLLAVLPDDPIKQAMTAQALARLAQDPNDPMPESVELADALATHVYQQIPKAEPTAAREWRALIWVAERKQDYAKKAALLRNLALLASSDFGVQFELAAPLHKIGKDAEAIKVLEALKNRDQSESVKYHCDMEMAKIRGDKEN